MLPARSVCLDVQGAQNRAHFDRGIPRYVLEQMRGVVRAAPEAVHSVAMNPWRPLTGNLEWLVGTGLLQWGGTQSPPPATLPEIYHAMSPFELDRSLDELWPAWARTSRTRLVVTLFDLIPLIFSDFYLRDPMLKARYLARGRAHPPAPIRCWPSPRRPRPTRSACWASPSASWRSSTPGVSELFGGTYTSDGPAWGVVRDRFPHIRPGFLFYVAGIEWRKNIERLIEAYSRMSADVRARHQLVITCRMKPDEGLALRAQATRGGAQQDELVLTDYVTDTELAALYRVCRLFVFASFYEGSGLPILEAMAAGVPVLREQHLHLPRDPRRPRGDLRPVRPGRHRARAHRDRGPTSRSWSACASGRPAASPATRGRRRRPRRSPGYERAPRAAGRPRGPAPAPRASRSTRHGRRTAPASPATTGAWSRRSAATWRSTSSPAASRRPTRAAGARHAAVLRPLDARADGGCGRPTAPSTAWATPTSTATSTRRCGSASASSSPTTSG